MEKGKKGNGAENFDAQISLAMDKIVQDTIGGIPVSDQIDGSTHKKKKGKKVQTAEDDFDIEEEGKKKGWGEKLVLALLVLAVLAGGGTYGYYTYYYSDKFFPNTTINNISCGGMTPEQTEE
jgi:hypothetical protein